jgi:transposase-like protein
MKKNLRAPKSDVVAEMPAACASEAAAVEFFERKLWGDTPCCRHCGSVAVYQMKDRATGKRNARFLWRCRDCSKQYTVRVGTIFSDSPIPLHKWARVIWEASSAKNGVSAMEMSRKLEISYKSALFMMHRVRHAMAEDFTKPPKLDGVVEADETYVGGKPRHKGSGKRGRGTMKQPVAAVLQRGGTVRTRVIPIVNAHNVKAMLRDNVAPTARVMTDMEGSYRGIGREFASHEAVNHGAREYVRGDVTTNTVEGFFSRVKRGINGVYHAVSKQHLHRYMSHFEYMHNTRALDDGQRIQNLTKRAVGKRLTYAEQIGAA